MTRASKRGRRFQSYRTHPAQASVKRTPSDRPSNRTGVVTGRTSRVTEARASGFWPGPDREGDRRRGGPAPIRPAPARRFARADPRRTRPGETWRFPTWNHTLTLGQPLPTLPLWLADDLAVSLELEETYEETCRILRLP